jgi:hypothetical protein
MPKAFQFAEWFSKPARLCLSVFKTGKNGPIQFSKVAAAMLPAFQKIIVYWKHIWWIGPDGFSKALNAAPKNLSSIMSKRFEHADFQQLWQIKKAFGAQQLRTSLVNKILNGELSKL